MHTPNKPIPPEPFVSAEQAAADFLPINRRLLLPLARRGIAGAYALGTGESRNVWIFRLSDPDAVVTSQGGQMHKEIKK